MNKNLFKRLRRKISLLLFNNILINRLFIFIGSEEWIQRLAVNWKRAKYDFTKTPEENVGFSQLPEIEESRNKMHLLLRQTAQKSLKPGDAILEVGCGTGLFLTPLQNEYAVTGIDLSKSFLSKAQQLSPRGKFIEGDYLKRELPERYNLIFLESSFQYFLPGSLKRLFKKFYDDLQPDGLLIIHYPHALSLNDALYGNLIYVRYTPQVVEKNLVNYFFVLEHHHYTDNRIVKGYDKHRYYFPGSSNRTDTNLNTYLLIAQRKQ